jgi:hypothetical protein
MPVQFDPKLTLDGLMTLAGGALALIGVWWNNHRSTANLQKQLDAGKAARIEETERQKQALANAVRFEIDGFYLYHLRELRNEFNRFDPRTEMPISVVKPIAANPFSIYQGNAGKLGELEAEILEQVVAFYNSAGRHVSTCSAWGASMRRILAGRSDTLEVEAARRLAAEIQQALPLQLGWHGWRVRN